MSRLRKRGPDPASEASEEQGSKPRRKTGGRGSTPAERKPKAAADRKSKAAADRRAKPARDRKPRSSADRRARTLSADVRKASAAAVGVGAELLKLVREMLVIPAQIWLAIAEVAGTGVLFAWRRVVLPVLSAVLAIAGAAYRLALRHLTPARAVTAVCLVAIGALAASQWLDYRGITVGTDAYSGDLAVVAPAPEVDRERAGDAHSWVMLPLAFAGLVVLALALTGRPRAARLLIALGIAAIAIGVAIDAPKGLDEGEAAIAYQGAEARLLEGFWVQIAAGAVLIAGGLLLPRYLRPAPAASRATATAGRGRGGTRRILAGTGAGLRRGGRGRPRGRGEGPVEGEGGVSGAST